MKSNTYRLDRFIAKNTAHSKSQVRLLVAQKRVFVDDEIANSVQQLVRPFTKVVLDGVSLRETTPLYVVLNKPKGVVSATVDDEHPTVIDLIDHPRAKELHIVGRLDLNTTGLVLLTNDGKWSRRISLPTTKQPKVYEVSLAKPVTEAYSVAFAKGIYFAYEDITTQPAKLEVITPTLVRLTLMEGKYHQVKRMFGHFRNEVLALHRLSVGNLSLDGLEEGAWRELTVDEVSALS